MKYALIGIGGFAVGLIAAAVTAYVIQKEIEKNIADMDRLLSELNNGCPQQ